MLVNMKSKQGSYIYLETFFEKWDSNGLQALDGLLSSQSYIYGFEPSSLDAQVYESIKSVSQIPSYSNVLRWFHHIQSYGNDMKSFLVNLC